MQKFLVIGLGVFGQHIAKSLSEYGSAVTGFDLNQERLDEAGGFLVRAVKGDAAERLEMANLPLQEYAGIVVGMGDAATNMLVVMLLKELGAPHIIARASSEEHCRALERIGVFDIVYPDRDAATRAGKTHSMRNVLDYIPLTGEYVVMNLHPPKSFIGRSIRDLAIGARFQCQILGIKFSQGDKNWKPDAPEWENMKIAPTADDVVPENSVLLFLGRRSDLKRIQELD
jgi:trk system potassium uptake protein TrkA